jgi:hypothetical protein
VPSPNCEPCEMICPQPPPMMAPQDDVAQLVRHHAGNFALGVGRLDHAAVDEHRTARQCEGVDLFHVDRLEGVLELGMPQV